MQPAIETAYAAAMEQLQRLDWPVQAGRIGATHVDRGLQLPFFGQLHRVTAAGCFDPSGEPVTPAVGLALASYVLRFPAAIPADGQPITFRELTGSGPLAAGFSGNTHKTLANAFGRSPDALRQAAAPLGGQEDPAPQGFDLAFCFPALPHLPLFLRFNGADDDFPAQAVLLFNRSADSYLDPKGLYILATYLTGRLIAAAY